MCVSDLTCKKEPYLTKQLYMIYEKGQLLKHHKNSFVHIIAAILGIASMYTKLFF